jgi:hypothetical protein
VCEIGETTRSTHDTKAAAIKRGCLVAHQRACELVIHAHDGTVREEGRPGIDFRGIPG